MAAFSKEEADVLIAAEEGSGVPLHHMCSKWTGRLAGQPTRHMIYTDTWTHIYIQIQRVIHTVCMTVCT